MENAAAPDLSSAVELYGSFHLGQTELALPVAALQEVVNYPAAVTRVPLAPPHLLGLFNLRGTLIPIVDLCQLLRLPGDRARPAGKIAIVELGEARVGLLFDGTGEILRVPAAQKVTFEPPANGIAVIAGALKLNGGERILQILSAAALLGLPDMPRLQHRADSMQRRAQRALRQQTVSFRAAGAHVALPMAAIQEIIRVPALLASPLADGLCIGMLNLRGATLPVVDLARFLGAGSGGDAEAEESSSEPGNQAATDERRIVIFQQQDVHVGLLVDEVRSIVGYHADDLLPMPAYCARQVSLFAGCFGHDGQDSIILLSPAALLAHPQLAAIAEGHRELYRAAGAAAAVTGPNARRHTGVRETYVMFRLGHLLGVRIRQLREVIDYGGEIVTTPGAPSFVRGVLHLRRELITVVDVRAMLGMAPYDDLAQTKILIVEHGGEKFGLVVDTVDNIVTLDDGERVPVPGVLLQQAGAALRGCMTEAIELPGRGMLMLIDLGRLCEHVWLEVAA
ncbi:hypothetical protein PATSB16_12330 [Pandoraea thiooxydans]|uniref:CheW-like domain-containing protein n=1 Tax=Pandoraea thiooxydans TaxID=445709 RepID=A0A0G3EKP6_9BURK|nr:chemotaxis protein CheW [Pandoraea thiooxydans]AKJ67515.2 hypothetical protein ABW99_03990 [Pandoraea thiooxydans]APR94575.1 hypothetical protein PATSB16_12330 [Pandoraea thiooxydans]